MNILKKTHSFLFISLCLMLPVAHANQAADQLAQLLASYQSLSAHFTQKIVDEDGAVMQEAQGNVALNRPDHLRWYTQTPTQQLIIADGHKLWIYDVDLEQVTVESLKRLTDTGPAMLLTGAIERLQQHFSISGYEKQSHQYFKLVPKTADDLVQWIELEFVRGKITNMRLLSQLNQVTELHFKKVTLNPNLKQSLFYFKPPSDVDVIDNSTA